MRRSLPLQVGEEGHAFRTRWHRFGLCIETRIDCALIGVIGRDSIAIPGIRASRRQHDAHDVPEFGRNMTKRVHPQCGIHHWRCGGCEHRAGGAPACNRLARSDDPDAGCTAGIVRTAENVPAINCD